MSVATVKRCMSRMNAIVLTKYATPDALELREVERPVPTGDEVLIKVHAAAVNDWDLALVYGKPLFLRAIVGLLKPKNPIIGCEVAGQIVAVGDNVRHRTPGEDYTETSARAALVATPSMCASGNKRSLRSHEILPTRRPSRYPTRRCLLSRPSAALPDSRQGRISSSMVREVGSVHSGYSWPNDEA